EYAPLILRAVRGRQPLGGSLRVLFFRREAPTSVARAYQQDDWPAISGGRHCKEYPLRHVPPSTWLAAQSCANCRAPRLEREPRWTAHCSASVGAASICC